MNLGRLFGNIYVKNLLWAILIIIILVVGVLCWLNFYTHHNEAVVVPNIKGLQVEEAAVLLRENNLRFEVDSVFRERAVPGSIVNTIPPIGSKVKENRIVFITIQAFSMPTIVVPDVRSQSQRQALALLNSAGFKNIIVEYVPAEYKDLVIGLTFRNRDVRYGERLSMDSRLTLLVGSGEMGISEDSPNSMDSTVDSEWFETE